MKTINSAAVIRDGDRLHELLTQRRDLIREVREKMQTINEEIDGLNKRLLRANDGQDFLFPSSDSYMKVVDFIMEDEGAYDVEKMVEMLLKLRRKIPRKEPKLKVIVRHLSDEEIDLIED
jgi:hypothetical protein